jgi:hypothetical protein
MMVLTMGPTTWIAVGDDDVPAVVERIVRPADVVDMSQRAAPPLPPRSMPAPAPLAMPLQEF